MIRVHVPRSLASVVVLIAGLATVVGVLTFVINQFIDGVPQLVANVQEGFQTIQTWLIEGPLHLEQEQIDSFFDQLSKAVGNTCRRPREAPRKRPASRSVSP